MTRPVGESGTAKWQVRLADELDVAPEHFAEELSQRRRAAGPPGSDEQRLGR